jgi:S-(hydroxymethyl)glutathione dehydrogenase/alcohol dehydrogenase
MGQCPVRKYSDQLLHMIETGRIDATQVISHRMKLDEAAKGYQMFDGKAEVHKIVLTP